jgi:hypothetical protein
MSRQMGEKEGNFRLICGRNGIAALMGLFRGHGCEQFDE